MQRLTASTPKLPSTRRSTRMHEALRAQGCTKIADRRHFIPIEDQDYRVLDGTVTDFSNKNEPLVSIGGEIRGEWIVLDPSSPELQNKYNELYKEVRKHQNIEAILNTTIQFVRDHLNAAAEDKTNKTNAFCANRKNWWKLYKTHPLILLDTFIKKRTGVCRHHGLFISYLIHRLIKDKLLPIGHVYHHRYPVENGIHVWAIYKPLQPAATHCDIYVVDSMWHESAYNIKNSRNWLENMGYGKAALEDCLNRYNKPDLTYIPFDAYKSEFLAALLSVNREQCRKFLNHQYRLSTGQIIKSELTRRTQFSKEAKIKYKHLIYDIDLILDTEYIHGDHYSAIDHIDERQQFVSGLLYKPKEERLVILKRQNRNDLYQLKLSLETETPARNDLYQQLDDYQDLTKEVNHLFFVTLEPLYNLHYSEMKDHDKPLLIAGLLHETEKQSTFLNSQASSELQEILSEVTTRRQGDQELSEKIQKIFLLRLIHLIQSILLSEQFRIKPHTWASLWSTERKIEGPFGNILIPKSFKRIYAIINEVNPESLTPSKLIEIITEVKQSASHSISNSKKKPDNNDKQRQFLLTLCNTENFWDLYENLKAFQQNINPEKTVTSKYTQRLSYPMP